MIRYTIEEVDYGTIPSGLEGFVKRYAIFRGEEEVGTFSTLSSAQGFLRILRLSDECRSGEEWVSLEGRMS